AWFGDHLLGLASSSHDENLHEPLQDLPSDDHTLDLIGALVDLGDLGVAHHALNRVLAHVPVAAEDLYRVGGDLHGDVTGEGLGHAGEVRHAGILRVDQARGLVHEQPGRLDLHGHVGEHEL